MCKMFRRRTCSFLEKYRYLRLLKENVDLIPKLQYIRSVRCRSCGDVIGGSARTVHSAIPVYTYSVVKYFLVSGRI